MKKLSRKILALLLMLLMLATCLLTGCGKKEDKETTPEASRVKEVFYGENGEIPCLELTDASYAVSDVVEWDFIELGFDAAAGWPYGQASETVVQEEAPIVNWYYGDGTYLTRYDKPDFDAYTVLVEEMLNAGYQVYSTGSISNGDVQYTLLTYKDFVYDVIYCLTGNYLIVTAGESRPLSPYLLEDNPSTQSEAVEGKETTLNMLSWQESGGDNYIIQLKNGNFILFDGGAHHMFKQALDFMKANTPAGQTPVVEAWFITHGHYDHVGWTRAYLYEPEENGGIFGDTDINDRVRVNGIYYNMPKEYILENTIYSWRSDGMRNKTENVWAYRVHEAAKKMLTADGLETPVYRPQTGQTFYFKDLTVEVPYTQEHITFAEYQMDINAASTWYVVRAEGRAFLDGGDTENVNLEHVKNMYTSDYVGCKPDIMSAFHHGHNIYDQYIDWFYAPIVFYTSKTMFSWAAEYTQANKIMLSRPSVSYYCYGDGAYQYNFATGEVKQIG